MTADATRRRLTLLDATCIMVGIVVGSGIFATPADVARASPNLLMFFGIWIAGGIASLLGAMCFAELATRYPEDGGIYAYLTRAFGPWAGFLFAWADFWIVRPANVGAVAFVLGAYVQAVLPLPHYGELTYSVAAVAVTTAVHLCGLQVGRWSQNVMTLAKVLGLMLIVGAAITMPAGAARTSLTEVTPIDWPQAWVLVMFCYGGWSDLTNVAAEVREPARNMLRALVLGVAAITALYLAINAAAVYALGLETLAASQAMAVELVEARLQAVNVASEPTGWGGPLVSLLVAIACLSSLSGVAFTGARIYFALGTHNRCFAWLARWDAQRHTPPLSLMAQGAISCLLLVVAGQNQNGFERLVIFAGPCYWGFTLLASLAVIVLRVRDRKTPVPFRTPLYPVTPILFAGVCGWLVLAAVEYLLGHWEIEAWYSLGVLAIGAIVAFITTKKN